jgi:hypothetical protein
MDAAWPRYPTSKFLTTVHYNPHLLKSVETPSLNSPQLSPFVQRRAATIARHVKLKAYCGVVLSDSVCCVQFPTFSEEME